MEWHIESKIKIWQIYGSEIHNKFYSIIKIFYIEVLLPKQIQQSSHIMTNIAKKLQDWTESQ